MQLGEFAEPLAYELAVGVQAFGDDEYPLPELGRLSVELSSKFRVLGIIMLVANGDAESFHQNLSRSALVRYKYLKMLQDRGITGEHHQSASRYEGLVDALACGNMELVREIARYSPPNFNEGHEYESDYCYGTLLAHIALVARTNDVLIERFEKALEGESRTRLDLVRALLTRDQQAFDDSFQQLLNERVVEIDAERKRGEAEEYWVIAERRVFVEALALLRLAALIGIRTQTAYAMCPGPARGVTPTKFDGF